MDALRVADAIAPSPTRGRPTPDRARDAKQFDWQSAIYEGNVRHRRFSPRPHHFRYALFMMYLDLAELPAVLALAPLWSNEGRGLACFRRRDHLKGLAPESMDLAAATRAVIERRCGFRPAGPIRLLTHLEYFGYRFNPVSFYYCFDASGTRVEALIAEINNTPWGEQHCYVLPRSAAESALVDHGRLQFAFSKEFHISPFMPLDMDYCWVFTTPGKTLAVHMENHRAGECVFDATMTLHRRPISRSSLLGALARYPFMTARVIGGIYWQALRLWMKRTPYVPHPAATRGDERNPHDE